MKKIYCVIYGKYRKLKNSKISYLIKITLVFSIIYCARENEDGKIFKQEESVEILKNLGLT